MNTILQLSIPYTDLSPPSHSQNFKISLTTTCGYTLRRTAQMSEQANRKSIAAYTRCIGIMYHHHHHRGVLTDRCAPP